MLSDIQGFWMLTPGSLFFCTDSDRSPPAAYSMAIARWCGVRNTSCRAEARSA